MATAVFLSIPVLLIASFAGRGTFKGVPPALLNLFGSGNFKGVPATLNLFGMGSFRGVPATLNLFGIGSFRGVPAALNLFGIGSFRGVPVALNLPATGILTDPIPPIFPANRFFSLGLLPCLFAIPVTLLFLVADECRSGGGKGFAPARYIR